jgi:predicted MFS family arabinose efflux permease
MSPSRWTALAVLTLARTAMGFQFQSVGAVAPLLMDRLGIANAELGILIGLFSLPGVVLALPGGFLGQRFGDRRLVIIGLVLMTLGSALIGEATTFSVAVVGRFLTAVGAVLLNVLGTKMVADWFSGRELGLAMATFVNSWPIGNVLALFMLPTVASFGGVRPVFHVAAGMAALGVAAMTFLYQRPTTVGARAESLALMGLSRREGRLVTLAAMPWMLYNVGYAVMLGFVPTLLVRGGFTIEEAGVLLGVSLVLLICSVQLGAGMAQRLVRPAAVVTVGLVAFAVALALLPYVPPLPTLLVIGILAGLPAASLVGAPAEILRSETRAPGMGLFYTWYYAGMALLPGVAGWLQDALGGAAAVQFAAATILMTLGSYLAFRAAVESPTTTRSGRGG